MSAEKHERGRRGENEREREKELLSSESADLSEHELIQR